jgi:hypothetical protein
MASCEPLGFMPQRRDFDPIDAVAPRVPLNELRLELAFRELLGVEPSASCLTKGGKLGFDVGTYFIRERAMKVRAQDAIVGVLVSEHWR